MMVAGGGWHWLTSSGAVETRRLGVAGVLMIGMRHDIFLRSKRSQGVFESGRGSRTPGLPQSRSHVSEVNLPMRNNVCVAKL